ncbi:hypothetical protein DWZ65_00480 [Roseburia sp. AF34-16]|uniref:hypothetical protein n=1 Tax=Roseburia sp. AF34-16 TaxID=2293136 RepID=UPI000E4A27A4|nr:hypothetical protein [Roseburia sp. AF34-16]RGF60628.1 hypothetical protein DWZ65_00480 [Roseburia sp. AF34-16]
MNINSKMKKLQMAILQSGLAISINRSQFYSVEQNRFIPMVSLSTKVFHYYERLGEWKDQTFEIIRTSSQADALMCLLEIYKAVGNGDNSNI